ncbi:MAG: hypothetical protein NTV84_06615 [Methanoregula sp.]|nr:hypothetical protein [Methanoregula sp.]
MSDNPIIENSREIRLKVIEFESNLASERGYKNREYSRRGMSRCARCQAKLMAILSRGYSLKKIERILHEKHPDIKDIRKYTKNVIREVTGWGIFDDYIHENKLWALRKPILAPPEIHKLLWKRWDMLEVAGKVTIRGDKRRQALERVDIHAPPGGIPS